KEASQPRGVLGVGRIPMNNSAARAAEPGMKLVQAGCRSAAAGSRRDQHDILALRTGASGRAETVAGHTRRLVVDRPQTVAGATSGVIGHPFFDEKDLAARLLVAQQPARIRRQFGLRNTRHLT